MKYDELKKIMEEMIKPPVHKLYTSRPKAGGYSMQDALREYQTPERDEQGTYYGYKILHVNYERKVLVSPRFFADWVNGYMESDHEPSEEHNHGIHFTKRPDNYELEHYKGQFHGSLAHTMSYYFDERIKPWVLVRCALGGTIVEREQGFRVQRALIVGVLEDGNWKSYQDYSQRAFAHSDRVAEEKRIRWEGGF